MGELSVDSVSVCQMKAEKLHGNKDLLRKP